MVQPQRLLQRLLEFEEDANSKESKIYLDALVRQLEQYQKNSNEPVELATSISELTLPKNDQTVSTSGNTNFLRHEVLSL